MHIRSIIPIFFLVLLISGVFAINITEREVTQEQLESILSNTNNRAIIDLKFENDYVFDNVDLSVITNNTTRTENFKFIDDFIKYDMRTTGEELSPQIYYYYFTNLLPRKEIVSIDLYYYNKREINSNIKLKPYILFANSPYRLNQANYNLSRYPQNKLLEYENRKDFGYNLFSYKVSPIEYNGRQNKLYLYDLKFVITLGNPLTEELERGRERLVLPNIIPVSDDNLKIETSPSFDQLLQEDYLINDNRQNQEQGNPSFTQANSSVDISSQVIRCGPVGTNTSCDDFLTNDNLPSFSAYNGNEIIVDFYYNLDEFTILKKNYLDQNNNLREVCFIENNVFSKEQTDVGNPEIYYQAFSQLLPLGKDIEDFEIYFYNPRVLNLGCDLAPALPVYNTNAVALGQTQKFVTFNDSAYNFERYPEKRVLNSVLLEDYGLLFAHINFSPIVFNLSKKEAIVYDARLFIKLKSTDSTKINLNDYFQEHFLKAQETNPAHIKKNIIDKDLLKELINKPSPKLFNQSNLEESQYQVMYCNYIESNPICEDISLDDDSTISFDNYPVGLSLLDLSYNTSVNLKIFNRPFLNDHKFLEIGRSHRLYNPDKIYYFISYQDNLLSTEEYEQLKSDLSLNLVSEKKYKRSLNNYSNNQNYCFGEYFSNNSNDLEEINTNCFSNKSKGYFYVFLFKFPVQKRTFFGLFNTWHLNYFLNNNNQFISTDNYFQENNNFIKHKIFAIDQDLGGINSSCVNDLCFNDFSMFSILENNELLDLIEPNTYTKQNIIDVVYNSNVSAKTLNGSKTFIIDRERLTNQTAQIRLESDTNFTENTVFVIIDSAKQRDIDLFDVSLLETTFYSPHNIPTVSDQTLENNYFAFKLLSDQEKIFLNIDNTKKNLSVIITNPIEKKFTSFNLLQLDQTERIKYNLYLTNINIAKHYCNDCDFYIYGVPNFKYLIEQKTIFDNDPIPCLDPKGQKVEGYTGKDSYNYFELSPFLYTWSNEKITNRTCDYGIYFCDADQLKTSFSKKIDLIKNNQYTDLGGLFFESSNGVISSFDDFVYNDEISLLFLQNSFNEFDSDLLTLDDYLNRSEELLRYDFYLPPEYYDYSIFNIDVRYLSDSDFQDIVTTHIKNYNKLNDFSVYQFRVSDYVNNYNSFKSLILSSNNKNKYENYLYNFANFYDLNNNYLSDKIIYGNGLNSFIVVTNKDLTTQDTKNIFSEIRFLDNKYSFVSDLVSDFNSNIYVFSFNDINFTTNKINYTFKNLSKAFERSASNIQKNNNLLSTGLNARTNNFGNLIPNGFNLYDKYLEITDYSFDELNDGYILKIIDNEVVFSNTAPIVAFSSESTDYRVDLLIRGLRTNQIVNSWLVKTNRDFLKIKNLNSDSENNFALILDPQDVLARLVLFDLVDSSNNSMNLSSKNRLSFTSDLINSKQISGQYIYEFPKTTIARSNTNLESILYGINTNKICFNIDKNNNLFFWNNLSNQDDLILSEALSFISELSAIPENTPVSSIGDNMFFVKPIPSAEDKKEMLSELFVFQNSILLKRFYSLDNKQTNYVDLASLKSRLLTDFENISGDDLTKLKELSNNYFSNDYDLSLSDYNKNTLIVTDSSDLFLIPGTIIIFKYKNSDLSIPVLSIGNINNDLYVTYIKNNSLVFETLDKAINNSLLFENKLNNKLEKPNYFFVHFSRSKVSDLIIKRDLVNKNNKNKSVSDMLDYLIFSKSN